MLYNALTYTFPKTDTEYNRLIVRPTDIPQSVAENGLIEPSRENTLCEVGIVVASCKNSDIKVGDEVFYNKIDRTSDEILDTVEIDGEKCDVIFENEVWCWNEKPRGRVFVEAFSELEANENDIVIPSEAKGITQKGRVISAPPEYKMEPGDTVEFRKQEMGIFPEVLLQDIWQTVLYEADIFKVNGKAAPYRIIVKIDMVAQQIKQTSTKKGLALSPLFKFMLRNLQLGEVVDMGEEAKKMYPEVSIGDTLILHHVIEAQPYRLVGRDFGKLKRDDGQQTLLYEYRAINCWDPTAREFFGKLNYEKRNGKIRNIVPLNGSVFMKWDFNMVEAKSKQPENAVKIGTDLSAYHDMDDFTNAIKHKKSQATENAKYRVNGLRMVLQQINPLIDKDRYDALEAELKSIQREETRIAAYINRNHLLVCKRVYPAAIPAYVVAPYEQLYPINILGQKFLIGNDEFIYAQSTKNMDISATDLLPLGKWALILPIEETKDTELLVPTTAKEKPQKGHVLAISEHKDVKAGDLVLFRKAAGLEQDLDGITYLLMRHDDLIAVVPKPECTEVIAETSMIEGHTDLIVSKMPKKDDKLVFIVNSAQWASIGYRDEEKKILSIQAVTAGESLSIQPGDTLQYENPDK